MTKVCTKCNQEMDLNEFYKDKTHKDGLRSKCKKCTKEYMKGYQKTNKEQIREYQKEYRKQYYQANKEQIREQRKQYYQANEERIKEHKKEYDKQWYQANREQRKQYYQANEERIKEIGKQYYQANKKNKKEYRKQWDQANKEKIKQYYQANKDKINLRKNNKYKNDINYRLSRILRNRLGNAIKNQQKIGSAVKDLGCSVEFLKQYLESKFQPKMTWQNHGEWHLDHIIPLSTFNLTNREELLKACNYTNLQPLWAKDNLVKSNKIVE